MEIKIILFLFYCKWFNPRNGLAICLHHFTYAFLYTSKDVRKLVLGVIKYLEKPVVFRATTLPDTKRGAVVNRKHHSMV